MFNLSIKNIFYKKTRSLLTIMGIVIAMQLYIVLSGIMNAYEKDIQKQVSSMAGKVFVQLKTEGNASMLPIQNVIDEKDADFIEGLDGIDKDATTKVLYNEVVAASAPNLPPTVFVAGIEQGKEEAYFGKIEVEGKSKIASSNEIILGSTAAWWADSEQNAKLNDKITLGGKKFTIVGILPSVNTTIDSAIIMSLETAQELYGKNDLVNAVIVTAKEADRVDELAKAITDSNDKLLASTSEELKGIADDMLSGQRMFFALINDTIVFVAIFMVMIMMIMAINERKKEIGTLKAIGASYPKILFMVMSESVVLSTIGGLLALPLSLIFTFAIAGEDFETLLTYNDPKAWPMILFVTIIIGLFSGIIPALSTRKINPLESIRYE